MPFTTPQCLTGKAAQLGLPFEYGEETSKEKASNRFPPVARKVQDVIAPETRTLPPVTRI
jgi:hypothetical protein